MYINIIYINLYVVVLAQCHANMLNNYTICYSVYMCTCVCVRACACVYTCACVRVCACTCVCMCVCVCVLVKLYMYIVIEVFGLCTQ